MTIREELEAREAQFLAPYAAHSAASAGRARPQQPCPMRTEFQRDRDRILHCRSFRRLKQKTQVFLSPESDHYRTRLTHTLEATQIARTIARALALNEDLTEAIGLGHDLGHTPFGHAGERALNDLCPGGFTHYEQSARVVQRLENGLRGLNLTAEVVDGILCHTCGAWAGTLEGQALRWADRIAYINHDIEDAIHGGVLSPDQLPADCVRVLGASKSQRITSLITALVQDSAARLAAGDRPSQGSQVLTIEGEIGTAFAELHRFMYATVYKNSAAKAEEYKVERLIGQLYRYFCGCPDELPTDYQTVAAQEGVERAVADYISGMSDEYAVHIFESVFVPRKWNVL